MIPFEGILGSAFIIGLVVGFWNKIKYYLYNLFSLVFTSVILEKGGEVPIGWLIKNKRFIRLGTRNFSICNLFGRKEDRWLEFSLENMSKGNYIFFDGWKPFFCKCNNSNLNNENTPRVNNMASDGI